MCCHLPVSSRDFVRVIKHVSIRLSVSNIYRTNYYHVAYYQLCIDKWNITTSLSGREKRIDDLGFQMKTTSAWCLFACCMNGHAWHIELVIHKSNSSKHQFDGDLRNFRHTAHTDRNTNGSVRLFWFTVKKNLLAGANWCERKTLLLVARIEWMSHYCWRGKL